MVQGRFSIVSQFKVLSSADQMVRILVFFENKLEGYTLSLFVFLSVMLVLFTLSEVYSKRTVNNINFIKKSSLLTFANLVPLSLLV